MPPSHLINCFGPIFLLLFSGMKAYLNMLGIKKLGCCCKKMISPHVYSGKYSINSSAYKYRLFVTNNLEDSFIVLHYN
jgi:hypothetical protein